ncbi:MAG: transposase [Polaribacter sp.]|jgi:transposase
MKKYRVTLTSEERSSLKSLLKSGKYKGTKSRRAQILLGTDESEGGKKMKDEEIRKAFDCGIRTIERLRQRFVEDGYEIALNGKPRPLNKARIFDGRVESHLLTLRCSDVPAGNNSWTLRLLADKMVELEHVEQMSYESVRRILKKRKLSLGK